MDDPFAQMRGFIMATEHLTAQDEVQPIVESVVADPQDALREDLERIVFKLRSFMESCGGDFALGVELGMQRAADMIENALRRHGG